MLGGKIQTVKLEENTNETETADFFVRYANQEVTLNIAYYMNGKITKTVVIWLVEFPAVFAGKLYRGNDENPEGAI